MSTENNELKHKKRQNNDIIKKYFIINLLLYIYKLSYLNYVIIHNIVYLFIYFFFVGLMITLLMFSYQQKYLKMALILKLVTLSLDLILLKLFLLIYNPKEKLVLLRVHLLLWCKTRWILKTFNLNIWKWKKKLKKYS